jgi:tRNA pseudouridine synthase 10
MSGLSSFDSIEGVIAEHLMSRTGGQTPKFSWLGSEDRSSLVLGKGRPFYAKIFDPRKRKLGRIRIRDKSVAAVLSSAGKSTVPPMRFAVKTRIVIRCDRNVSKEDLAKLRSLAGKEIRFDNRSKIATKKINSAVARRIDNNTIKLTIEAEGGLMIKQFVGGQEFMSPNVSEILGTKCECVSFDILDVQVIGPAT